VELLSLGYGRHYGEWWGQGIQRNYGLKEKRFSLFNTGRWVDSHLGVPLKDKQVYAPSCCYVVPVLFKGIFHTEDVDACIEDLRRNGSLAAPGFMRPEGVVVYHIKGDLSFKKTLEKDEMSKTEAEKTAA
jgi:hypothetical protein